MFKACSKEVVGLHRFFEGWFAGSIGPAGVPHRLERALSEEFRMVTPSGYTSTREQVIRSVSEAHGRQPLATGSDRFRISIADLVGIHERDGVALISYQEWQSGPAGVRGRQSSALFREDPAAPEGVVWLHLHETWLPESAAAPEFARLNTGAS